MSIATMILGESGTGKTASLRNLNPADTLLIQPVRKPLPFRSAQWREIRAKGDGGNIFVMPDARKIVQAMYKTSAHIVVLDDWQYILSRLYMEAEKSRNTFDLFREIGAVGYLTLKAASELPDSTRVYVLAHTQEDESGRTRIKTLGKLLDEKIVPEGLFTTVLRTHVENGKYQFQTHNNGMDTTKSPLGLFDEDYIDNDLAAVDAAICAYYGIPNQP